MTTGRWPVTTREIALWTGGSHHGSETELQGVAPLDAADGSALAFYEGSGASPPTQAGCLLCREPLPGTTCVVVPDPKQAFANVLRRLYPEPRLSQGVHPSAVVEGTLGTDCAVGPLAHVGVGAVLGDRVQIHSGVIVGRDCRVGNDTVIFPRAVLYPGVEVGQRCRIHAGAVLGADGFSFHPTEEGHEKVPQVGRVVLEDGVEVGANTCVDRAFLEETRLGAGTALDNLVQVGHNTTLGRGCLVAAQSGLSGSTRLGDGVILGGQVGVRDHVEIDSGVRVGAGSAVAWDLQGPGDYVGRPAQAASEGRRAFLLAARLPEIWRSLLRLEKLQKNRD